MVVHRFSAGTPIDPEAFKLVAALDLALMVPALIVGGVLYLLVLSVNSIVFIRRGLASAPGELPIWGSLTVLTSAAALLLLSRIER